MGLRGSQGLLPTGRRTTSSPAMRATPPMATTGIALGAQASSPLRPVWARSTQFANSFELFLSVFLYFSHTRSFSSPAPIASPRPVFFQVCLFSELQTVVHHPGVSSSLVATGSSSLPVHLHPPHTLHNQLLNRPRLSTRQHQ